MDWAAAIPIRSVRSHCSNACSASVSALPATRTAALRPGSDSASADDLWRYAKVCRVALWPALTAAAALAGLPQPDTQN